MQVNPLGAASLGVTPGQLGLLFLPDLLNLTNIGPQAQTLGAQREEEEERRQRDPAVQRQLAAAGLPNHAPAETIYQAERKMAPHSRAAQRQLLDDRQQRIMQQRQAFQRTLADAHGRAPAPAPRDGKPAPAPAPAEQPAHSARFSASRTDGAAAPSSSEAAKPDGTPVRAQPTNTPAANAATRNTFNATSNASGSQPTVVQAARLQSVAPTRAGSPAAAKPASGGQAKSGGPTAAAPTTDQARSGKTAAATRAARAATAEAGKSDANIERILRVVRSQISAGRSRAILRLDPPTLGIIRLQMDLRKDVLALRVDTHTAAAHRLLSEQIESLRQGLHVAGIQLEHVEIRPPAATTAADDPNLPQQPDGQQAGNDHSAHADAEHSPEQGTDSYPAEPPEPAARPTTPEPATESLVNILA